ncbi:MAG: DUF58 domain-containing protein [Actinomycetota bacterium]|nr:DUF58 domain-containing protein [Actinomycetota bacterium]
MTAVIIPVPLAIILVACVLIAAAIDLASVRREPRLKREVPTLLSRGRPAPLRLTVDRQRSVRVRQPIPQHFAIEDPEGDGAVDTTITALRRGRHLLLGAATKTTGPLGLAARHHRLGEAMEIRVYPDVHAAYRMVEALRRSRGGEQARLARGPLGLGTDFESLRDYSPDDDIRQVNWRATARLGRPMSNQYRIERDRDVICLLDAGRLMASPIQERTRLDAAVDAVAALAAVADELDDRCGVIAFDSEVRRELAPRRRGTAAVLKAVFDLEPSNSDSDYELAFRAVGTGKRSLVVVLTDLLDEAAARSLLDAVPILVRHHAVVVAGSKDTDLEHLLDRPPVVPNDLYESAVALQVVEERAKVAARLQAAGAAVVDVPPQSLGSACVSQYLRAKARARL